MNRQKIALFLNFDHSPGGAERRFARYYLKVNDPNLLLIINRDGRALLESNNIEIGELNVIEFDLLSKKFNLVKKILAVVSLWKIIYKFNITHIHYPIDPSIFTFIHSLVKNISRVTYSISLVDSSRKTKQDFGKIQYYLWLNSLRNASKVDILSLGILENIKSIFDITPNYEISPCSFTDYSKSKNAPEKEYDIVLMSRLVAGKGFDLFFSALDVLSRKGLQRRIGKIGIFGDGPLKQWLITNAKNYPDFSINVGYASDSFEVFSKARILLSLQKYENYPSQSILEALSCGVFVIATDVGETYKIVPNEIGQRVQPDPEILASAIVDAVENHRSDNLDPSKSINFVNEYFSLDSFSKYFSRFLVSASHQHDLH